MTHAPVPPEPPVVDRPLPAGRDLPHLAVPIYELSGVEAAIGDMTAASAGTLEIEEVYPSVDAVFDMADTEQVARLRRILGGGDKGRWRRLVRPDQTALVSLDALSARAPHLDEVSGIVRRHLLAASNMSMPLSLPPLILLGPPGTGKTWYLSRLADALGIPFRLYPMNVSTLGDGLQGGHPSWRNARPGLVAQTLLSQPVANFLVICDEFDKAQAGSWNSDPYRPFYTLLEPAGARRFIDEYLQFPMDASGVMWAMAANDLAAVPEPILDRLTVIRVPDILPEQRNAVARSIYADINASRGSWFDAVPERDVIARLMSMNPRRARVSLEDAMITAASEGRSKIRPGDVRPLDDTGRTRMGF